MKKTIVFTLCFLFWISSSVLAAEKIEGLSADQWLEKGQEYMWRIPFDVNSIDRVITACNNAISANPKLAKAYNLRGIAYSKKEKLDLAMQDYNKAIELEINFFHAHSNRGAIYANQCLYDQAVDDFNKAIALNSKIADAYNNRGNVYLKQGKYDLAVADFNKAIQYHPKRKEMEKFNKEFVDFTKSINDNPRDIENYYKRSELCSDYLVKYFYTYADPTPKKANQVLSTVTNTGGLLGMFAGLSGRGRDDDNTTFSGYSPYYNYSYPIIQKSSVFLTWGVPGPAGWGSVPNDNDLCNLVIDDSTKVIKSNSQYANADTYYNRGFAFLKKASRNNPERYDLAIRDFNKVIEIEPNNKEAYLNRAYAYSYKNLPDQAIANYSKVIEIDANHIGAYQNRGDSYMKKGLYDLAISDYSKIIDIMPKYHEIFNIYSNRGEAYFKKGLYAQAIDDCDKAIAKNSLQYDAYFLKAQALEKMERSSEAVNAYKRFLKYASKYSPEDERINEATERIAQLEKK